MLCLFPTLGAGLIAITRIEDARHHPFDVIFGSFLGILCAYVSYRQYFPSLGEPWKKGRAYPMRSWGSQPAPPSDAHAEREHERNQGKESLRRTPLPQTENEYDTLYQSSEYFGSNIVRPQVANRSRDQDFEARMPPASSEEEERRDVGHGRGGHLGQVQNERIELRNLTNNGGGQPWPSQESPFVSSLNKIR